MALAQISGSDHDFSGAGFSGGEICVVCHAPHNNVANVTGAPLWNHEVTVANFQVYTSDSLDAGDVTQPDGQSKLCLSCHDGTVAVDNFGTAGTSNVFVTGDARLDTDLRNDHPISFTYNSTLATADGELEDPSTATTALGGTIDEDMLFGGSLECASCHDVHDNTIAPFLRVSNSASGLCLTCHIK
jgi:predicted CXXCH cytochrome family protein